MDPTEGGLKQRELWVMSGGWRVGGVVEGASLEERRRRGSDGNWLFCYGGQAQALQELPRSWCDFPCTLGRSTCLCLPLNIG